MNNGVKISIGFWDLLLVAFIVLKLCGIIKWSWVWVLSPFWIPIIFIMIIVLLMMMTSKTKEKI